MESNHDPVSLCRKELGLKSKLMSRRPRNMIGVSLVAVIVAAAVLVAFAGSNVYALYAGTGESDLEVE